jgi:7-cyano-7-deazaguanine reductase
MVIDYIPHKFTVELKSIKLYVNSFRNERISHEGVTNAIADKFFKDVQPRSLRVIGDFMRRGGVKTVITVQRGESYDFASYQANAL